jgi:hypothetical protein
LVEFGNPHPWPHWRSATERRSGNATVTQPVNELARPYGPLPDHLEFDATWVFPDGVAAGGDTHIVLYSNGTVEFNGRFHDSGFFSYKYGVAVVLVDADRQAYSVGHQGHINGTVDGGSRNDDWDNTTSNEAVSQDWRAIVADMSWRGDANVDVDGALLNDVVGLVKTVGPIVGTIIALF